MSTNLSIETVRRLNVHERVFLVMEQIRYAQKDVRVKFKQVDYAAMTYDGLIALVRPCVMNARLVLAPSLVSNSRDGSCTTAVISLRAYNIDDPGDFMQIQAFGYGENGDKGPGSAFTYATKNALLKLFMLETGENDEARFALGNDNAKPRPPFDPEKTATNQQPPDAPPQQTREMTFQDFQQEKANLAARLAQLRVKADVRTEAPISAMIARVNGLVLGKPKMENMDDLRAVETAIVEGRFNLVDGSALADGQQRSQETTPQQEEDRGGPENHGEPGAGPSTSPPPV